MASDPYATRGGDFPAPESQASPQRSADASGVSWSAVVAGTAGAAALSLILLLLGAAFGFAVVSPWVGAGATAIGVGAILWLMFTHVSASALGGYLAGRLRVKWTRVNADEVFFRDTAHGFLTWALSTLIVAALIGAAIGSLLDRDNGAGEESGAGMAMVEGAGMGLMAGTTDTPGGQRGLAYHVDLMFRPSSSEVEPLSEERRNMAIRTLSYAITANELPDRDRQFLAQEVAYHTGMGQQQAEQHVEAVYQDMQVVRDDLRAALDEAAEATAITFGWMFIALLMAAFFASLAATWGGRHRDSWEHHV